VRDLDLDTYDPGAERFDSIVMVNVLEHIEDDGAALRKLREALRPGGRIILYVPAFMLLYSKFDREIGHYRRYKKAGLVELLRASGLRPIDARYVNSIGAPGWFLWVRVLGRASSDDVTIGACDRIVVPAARVYEDRWAPPFGLSVFAVAVRD
jgi:SAM-dependent methyltransferase